MDAKSRAVNYAAKFSFVGLAVATLFFAASVTPSLLPRHYLFQGLLSGFALALGYGLGVAGVGVYHFMEFRDAPLRVQRTGIWITTGVVAATWIACVWRMTFWQNSIRERMEMPPTETSYPYRMFFISVVTAVLLIAVARLTILCCTAVASRLNRVVPRRVSLVISAAAVVFLIFVLGEGVVLRGLLSAADSVFRYADGIVDEGVAQPTRRLASGSDESLIDWDTIGRWGKNFIDHGPTQDEIEEFSGDEALEPIRVYVGMRSRESNHQRAQLALEELQRVGAFDRSTLIVATPTGTGWLDPSGVDPIEYLLGGDCATVTMQYSYLPSWMTILVDPTRSTLSARALFDAVYDHWTTLPKESRPQLYVHGLSLGSLGSESAMDLVTLFEDPIEGAVLAGPPFPSRQWARIVASRNSDSPQWLPAFRDGKMVRFSNQFSPPADKPWGRMRIQYVQYASDPMVFFSPSLLYREADWMKEPRGADVTPYLKWRPIVTFLQVGFDLPMATSVPLGYGHNYAPADYIDAWVAVVDPPGWSDEDTERLKSLFAADK